jgi:hypothetical protein
VAALLGIFICFFVCLEMGTFLAQAVAFIIVPAILAGLAFVGGDKVFKAIGRIIRWL